MLHDLRFAFRQIGRRPWFAAAVILTLGLGIGVNTTVFTLVNVVLFKPVPVPGGDRLVAVTQQLPGDQRKRGPISLAEYRAYRDQSRTFAHLEAVNRSSTVLAEAAPRALPARRDLAGIVFLPADAADPRPALHGGRRRTRRPHGRAAQPRRLAKALRRLARHHRPRRPAQRPAGHDRRRDAPRISSFPTPWNSGPPTGPTRNAKSARAAS